MTFFRSPEDVFKTSVYAGKLRCDITIRLRKWNSIYLFIIIILQGRRKLFYDGGGEGVAE